MRDVAGAPCQMCGGTGRRTLTRVEAATVAALSTEWQDTRDVLAKLATGRRRVTHTALCNRLARLLSMGIVESAEKPEPGRGEGRMLQWRMKP
jgi:hypothetical protein